MGFGSKTYHDVAINVIFDHHFMFAVKVRLLSFCDGVYALTYCKANNVVQVIYALCALKVDFHIWFGALHVPVVINVIVRHYRHETG